jgi:hypothetical protein
LALAIYSGVTFVNMAIALHKTVHRDLPFKDIVSTRSFCSGCETDLAFANHNLIVLR